MTERIDRFSLVVGIGVLVLGGFATADTLGNVLNKGSLLTGLALGAAALAVAASTLGTSRLRRSADTLSVQSERQNPGGDRSGDEASRHGAPDV